MQFFLQLSFLFVCLTTISLSFPIEDPSSTPIIPLNPIEGHFTRSFTNEFELVSSSTLTPSVDEKTTSTTKPMEKKEILPEDQPEMTSTTEEMKKVEETKRNFDETEPVEVESMSTGSPVEENPTVQRSSMTKKEKPTKFVSRSDDDDEEEKPKKKLVEKTKSNDDESVESEELTTSSGLVAEFDPNVFDSISTPVGTQLKFDENHQSIERLTTEETSTSVVQEEEKEKEKDKELNETKLNQGSTLLLFILAAVLFCACLLASTLAFFKTRQSLKRKSRIIEMEAHLDDHFLHYHPLLFQQHFHK